MKIHAGWSATLVAAVALSGLVSVGPATAAPAPQASGQLVGELVTGATLTVDPTAGPAPQGDAPAYRGVYRFGTSACAGAGDQRADAAATTVTVRKDELFSSDVGSYYALSWTVDGQPVSGECFGPVQRGFASLTASYSPEKPAQGVELTAGGTVSPDSDLNGTTKRTYAWQLDGRTVGTGPTFTPTAEAGGQELVLVVTATRPGYADATARTTPQAVPQKAIGAPAPTVDDTTPAVGQELTASTVFADGARPEGTTVAYRWGVLGDAGACTTSGAASATHRVTRAELGARLCVVSQVAAPGHDGETRTSAPTDAVAPGTFTAVPTIDDTTPGVGQTLTAGPGTDDEQVAVSYRWGRDDDGECNLFDDRAAGATYTVRLADRGTALCVRGSYTSTGYEPATRSSAPTATVGQGTLAQGAPTIDDTTPVVGQRLTATDGFAAGAKPDGTTVTFRWGVRTGEVCTTSGDASTTHRVTRAELGTAVCVVAEASAPGYGTSSRSSAPTEAVAKGTISATPTIDDTTPVVGQRLTASPGLDDDQVSVAYRWGRQDGAECNLFDDRAAGATYVVRAGDLDGQVCVRGTYTSTGYETANRVSAATQAVARGTLKPVTPTISDTTPTFGDALTATQPRDGLPSEAVESFVWGVVSGDGAAATCTTDGDASSRHDVRPGEVGQRLCVVSTVTADGYTTGTATSAPTAAVSKAPLTVPTPAIVNTSRKEGAPQIDDVLRADVGTVPSGTVVDYAWGHVSANGCTAVGVTGPRFVVEARDGGERVCVVATGRRVGHADASATSAPTATVLRRIGTLTAPAITGGTVTPRLGETLAIARPAQAPKDATVAVAWGRTTSKGCVANGATGATYRLTTADLGRVMCATTTVSGAAFEQTETVVSTRANAVTEPARLVLDDRTIVGRQKMVIRGFGLKPGQTYRLSVSGKVVAKGTVATNGRYVATYAFPRGTASHSARAVRLTVKAASGKTSFSGSTTVSYRR